MISTWLMKLLLAQYILIATFSLIDGKPAQALYWLGAGTITISLLWGMK